MTEGCPFDIGNGLDQAIRLLDPLPEHRTDGVSKVPRRHGIEIRVTVFIDILGYMRRHVDLPRTGHEPALL